MVKVLITGGTGFIGSHIARQLVQRGDSVRVLHRETSKLNALDGIPFESAIGSLGDLDSLRVACEGVDWVFHVAAVADYWRANRQAMFEANVEGTRRVLQAACQAGVTRVVFTSSAAAVGIDDAHPTDETAQFNLPPEHFPYGYSKVLAEEVVTEAVAQGQDVVTVNPVVVMGPGDLNMISGTFMIQIKRWGVFTPITRGGVAVTDVRDVARWHIAAAEQGQTGERYILGTANYTYQEWFTMIAQVLGVPRPRLLVPNFTAPLAARLIDVARRLGIPTPIDATQARMGTRYVFFRFDKAWRALGEPQIDMKQSLQDTYTWYQQHGYL
ncbi:MAG: NAD-dependent epimerase/dehydratase family protein [Phototrophicales bacterium]